MILHFYHQPKTELFWRPRIVLDLTTSWREPIANSLPSKNVIKNRKSFNGRAVRSYNFRTKLARIGSLTKPIANKIQVSGIYKNLDSILKKCWNIFFIV